MGRVHKVHPILIQEYIYEIRVHLVQFLRTERVHFLHPILNYADVFFERQYQQRTLNETMLNIV